MSAQPTPSGPQLRFDRRAVLVTGAAAGIGEAAARGLAALGAEVVLADIDSGGTSAAAEQLRGEGHDAIAVACDVSQADQARAAVGAALEHCGQVDVLVNAAGGFRRHAPTWEMPEEEWRQVVDVNLGGTFLMSREVLPAMIERGYGRIVNVSSGAGRAVTHISGSHYAASKAGVLGFTRHLAREVAGHGITVNAVAPGTTLTPRIRELYSEARLREVAEEIPVGRLALPEDTVGAIAYLASEAAAYVTGVTLDIVGGRYLI